MDAADDVLDLDPVTVPQQSPQPQPPTQPPPELEDDTKPPAPAPDPDWMPLVRYDDLPTWYKDNTYILSGYRQPDVLSTMQVVRSCFRVHNETGNIWSHVLGCIIVLGLFIHNSIAFESKSDIVLYDQLAFGAFFLGAFCCFGLSSCFHTMLCKNAPTFSAWVKADYVGIVFLIWGSDIPTVRVLFYQHKDIELGYSLGVTTLSAVVVFVMVNPTFMAPKFRTFRAVLFSALGLAGIAPTVHYALSPEFHQYPRPVYLLIIMACLYLTGAVLFATRFPERVSCGSGRFDYWGNSHQIFHVLCVLAMYVHYNCVYHALEYRLENGRPDL